ncbi:MAG: hypothetical protein EP307_02035 [Rhodobacteraceae bacterium]|nr:MAG: hypothetical protein EP307_02035 [Paracoccaceae bacterium]
MSTRRPNIFLERETYRRRRVLDAARLLPVLGAALLALPLLWPQQGEAGALPMSLVTIYYFTVWALLILCVFIFGRTTRKWDAGAEPRPPRAAPQPGDPRGR